MRQVWTVRLGQQAEQDYAEVLQWAVKTFGEGQASTYAETIALAKEALEQRPYILGARAREDIQPGIRTLHAVVKIHSECLVPDRSGGRAGGALCHGHI